MQSPTQQRQNRLMPPESGFTNRSQTLIRPILHGLAKPLLEQHAFLLRARRSPASERILNGPIRIRGLQNPLELSAIELSNATGISVAEHWLERLAAQPEHKSQDGGNTGKENVLHAD